MIYLWYLQCVHPSLPQLKLVGSATVQLPSPSNPSCLSMTYWWCHKEYLTWTILQRNINRTCNLATLSQLHWLPVHDRIKFKTATMTHKAIYTGNPPYLANLVQWHTPCRTPRSAPINLLSVTRCNIFFGARGFCSAAPAIWNNPPLMSVLVKLSNSPQTPEISSFPFSLCHRLQDWMNVIIVGYSTKN